eukprot:TRINITY_DN23790_c0_g3_i1.p1 TRINITY_DN23790_c0_g3~~TRINITY_DN23790_c0_g3_i1.p1  ORF type:complete len:1169 (-),score=227.03 TRINITY_DN23790_c0_g3_i1:57-3107(-)
MDRLSPVISASSLTKFHREMKASANPPSPTRDPVSPESNLGKRPSGHLCDMEAVKNSDALNSDDEAIIVLRRLPFKAVKDEETGKWKAVSTRVSDDSYLPFYRLLVDAESCNLECKLRFVGFPGAYPSDDSEKKQIIEILAEHNCIPVFLERETVEQHLNFSNSFLWPVFHGTKVFDDHDESLDQVQSFEESGWKSYQSYNNAYALALEAHTPPTSLVWIQDYHLLLLPRYVYLRQPNRPVGLFVHCSFPSSEVLSCLPNREEILKALLCCRLIGFQIFDYLRNFISCCQIVLGAHHTFQQGGVMQIEHDSKASVIAADHFAIPYNYLAEKLESDAFTTEAAEIRERFAGKTIIGSYDKCDRFAGVLLKLKIFHQFLADYRDAAGKVVLVQYVNALDENASQEHHSILAEMQKLASATNNAFTKPGEPPVVNIIVEEPRGYAHRLATLNAMDIFLNTATNDGLNLVPFMFYLAHSKDKKGIAIVSEFCGCSCALTGSFKINPFNPRAVMEAIDAAMSSTKEAHAVKFEKEHSYISSQQIGKWFEKHLSELKRLGRQSKQVTQSNVAGFDATFRKDLATSGNSFTHLSADKVIDAYKRAKTRLLLLDAEGTLAAKASFKHKAGTALLREGQPPDSKVLDCLLNLSEDQKNHVYVISGRDPATMEKWFGHVKNLGLCAEHGFYWRPPQKKDREFSGFERQSSGAGGLDPRWRNMDADIEGEHESGAWKSIAGEVMKLYVKRVQGSLLEVKNSGVSWNYRGLGGAALIHELALELARFLDPKDPQSVLHDFPVKVVCGKGYVEVKRSDVDKGVAATRVLKDFKDHHGADFILCIGDDRSDEDMFAAIRDYCEGPEEMEELPPLTSALPSQNSLMNSQPSNSSLTSSVPATPLAAERATASGYPGPQLAMPMASVPSLPSSSALSPTSGLSRASVSRLKTEKEKKYFTVTVGRKPSAANHFVTDVTEVSDLLHKLASQSTAAAFSRYSSAPSMQDLIQLQASGGGDTPEPIAEESEMTYG